MIVLGIDTGLAKLGWALVDLRPDRAELLELGLVRTAKSDRKLNVRASSDRLRRSREQARALESIGLERVSLVCIEGQSWPRSASSSALIGMSFGIVATLAELHGLPICEASPQEIKRTVTGSASSSKASVLEAISELEGFGSLGSHLQPIPPSMREHPVDAIGAVLACRRAEIVVALLKQELER